jgi:ribonuclease HII
MSSKRLRGYDLRQIKGAWGLVGVDEAGRGALAGPVVAGAVLVNNPFLQSDWCRRYAGRINDSKQLTEERREHLYERMEWLMSENRILFAAGLGSVEEIDQHNIVGATALAMRRAILKAFEIGQIQAYPPDPLFADPGATALQPGESINDWKVMVDGRPMRSLGFTHRAVVGGDGRSLAIAMASIVAKVTRDRLMYELDGEYPDYGFDRHKGYGTEGHREALVEAGPSALHRKLFIRTAMAQAAVEGQEAFDFMEEEGVRP